MAFGVLLTITDVGNVTQGQGCPDHHVLSIGGLQRVQAFCRCLLGAGGGGGNQKGGVGVPVGPGVAVLWARVEYLRHCSQLFVSFVLLFPLVPECSDLPPRWVCAGGEGTSIKAGWVL